MTPSRDPEGLYDDKWTKWHLQETRNVWAIWGRKGWLVPYLVKSSLELEIIAGWEGRHSSSDLSKATGECHLCPWGPQISTVGEHQYSPWAFLVQYILHFLFAFPREWRCCLPLNHVTPNQIMMKCLLRLPSSEFWAPRRYTIDRMMWFWIHHFYKLTASNTQGMDLTCCCLFIQNTVMQSDIIRTCSDCMNGRNTLQGSYTALSSQI